MITGIKKVMKKFNTEINGDRIEKWINWSICIFIIILASEIWKILNERWISLTHFSIYIYAGSLLFYLVAERAAYRGSEIKGEQSKKWTLYLLLFFWGLLLIVPVLEYSLHPRYNFVITITGAILTVFGTGLRAWGIWTLGKYFSAHIEIKDGHKLVEKGPYKIIRHPAYAGNIIQALGMPLILNAYCSLSVSAVLITLFLFRMKLEEETLIQKVDGYSDYVKRTNRLIPKIW